MQTKPKTSEVSEAHEEYLILLAERNRWETSPLSGERLAWQTDLTRHPVPVFAAHLVRFFLGQFREKERLVRELVLLWFNLAERANFLCSTLKLSDPQRTNVSWIEQENMCSLRLLFRQRKLIQLQKRDEKQTQLEAKERGFSLYFRGANDNVNKGSHSRRKTPKTAAPKSSKCSNCNTDVHSRESGSPKMIDDK